MEEVDEWCEYEIGEGCEYEVDDGFHCFEYNFGGDLR